MHATKQKQCTSTLLLEVRLTLVSELTEIFNTSRPTEISRETLLAGDNPLAGNHT